MSTLGFVGYPGTGKDAIAQELVDNFGYERVAFGDAVKDMLLSVDPVYKKDLSVLEYFKRRDLEFTREKLQNIGQWMRDLDEDFWVRRVEELGIPPKAVFTDLRYANELAYVQRNCGGLIFGINRTGHGPVNDHTSEQNTTELLTYVDHNIQNDTTIGQAAQDIIHHAENRIRL